MASLGHYSVSSRDFFNPKKGSTLAEEIVCYGLPYGGLGFVSHLLTYCTIFVLTGQRSPLRPWKKLTHSTFDLCVAIIGLIGGMVLAIFTLVRCRHHWQLLLIGIWKLTMSVFNGGVGLHMSIMLETQRKKAQERAEGQRQQNVELSQHIPHPGEDGDGGTSSREAVAEEHEKAEGAFSVTEGADYGFGFAGLCIYICGLIVGLTGLISLIVQNWSDHPKLHIVTYVFSGVAGLCYLCICFWMGIGIARDGDCLDVLVLLWGLPPTLIALFAAMYSDWALGLMTGNLSGAPSGDNAALFWSYFALKRFTMLSS